MSSFRSWERWRRWLVRAMRLVVVAGTILVLVETAAPPPDDYYHHQLWDRAGGLAFDFASWEVGALLNKAGNEWIAPQDTLTPEQRHDLVVAYLSGISRASRLRWEINQAYSQYEEATAAKEAASREQELADLRTWLKTRQNLVEGILEEQVTTELEAEGFGRAGIVIPPVKIRFTPLPLLLVTSLRTEITREGDIHLKAGIPTGEQEQLEETVDSTFEDKRALVTPIGGLSAYPAMILETDNLIWLADTFAHEWTHHWLIAHPLGAHYSDSSQMTSINETTASIVGREIGRRVILNNYPELAQSLPPQVAPPEKPPMTGGEIVWPDEPPADQFDYGREMRETRLRVDELLKQGEVEEAEAYMEARRQMFVEQGYNIRKLNQAYFAFYGSYATSPSTGNPIGGQLEWLYGQSASLHDYLCTVARFSSHQDLLDLLPTE